MQEWNSPQEILVSVMGGGGGGGGGSHIRPGVGERRKLEGKRREAVGVGYNRFSSTPPPNCPDPPLPHDRISRMVVPDSVLYSSGVFVVDTRCRNVS